MKLLDLERVSEIITTQAPKPINERELPNDNEVNRRQLQVLKFILQTISPQLWTDHSTQLIEYLTLKSQAGSEVNEKGKEALRIEQALTSLMSSKDLLATPQYLKDRNFIVDPTMFFAQLDLLANMAAGSGYEEITF